MEKRSGSTRSSEGAPGGGRSPAMVGTHKVTGQRFRGAARTGARVMGWTDSAVSQGGEPWVKNSIVARAQRSVYLEVNTWDGDVP